MKIASLYFIFALIATIANIVSQYASLQIYNGAYSLFTSIMFGVTIGLYIKYILDKKYIFRFYTSNIKQNTQIFVLYSMMGIVTTFIFLAFELGFNYWFKSIEMRYIGGIIGLTIGYYIKYQLDKKYVFVSD